MNDERREFTFFWYIENFSYCWHKNGKYLNSPSFTVELLENTTWNLQMNPRGLTHEDKDEIFLGIFRSEQDDGPKIVSLKFEVSLLAMDGSVLCFNEYEYSFKKGYYCGASEVLNMDEILMGRWDDYLPQDTLSVQFKIWKGEGNIRNIGQSSARTRIKIEKNSFLYCLKDFSQIYTRATFITKIQPHSKKGRLITFGLYFNEEKSIMMEIKLSRMISANQTLCKCDFSLLDGSKNIIECGGIDNRPDTVRKTTYTIPLTLSMEEILNRKGEYLPDDQLSLICECTFSSGIEFNTIEETSNEMPLDLIKKMKNTSVKNDYKAAEKLSTNPSVLEDIKSLYINQCLTDVDVKTKTKSFPAHKIILCARSPVFKTMMTSDMKEKHSDSIQIDDLEDDIVQQLLLFLYSDSIDDFEWNTVLQLYYAADKYQICKLKEVCSSFLIENLTPTNAGELLLLADPTHSDGYLKTSVEDFILVHEEQVFGSKEWEALMETNPVLVMKAMHLKYKRNKWRK